MSFNLLFWRKTQNLPSQEISQPIVTSCNCGSGRGYEDCHGLEFALPDHERPDPD